eukprot:TRINITY_DN66204_c0_g1_i1.p1 TRINITY_DN66204_c0_g1~~TRINITY_DN66204_c0_g1_i1.p1  ORF type:complete len:503 (+),score=167.55 TRINITY_DN66204_c0_g1_i1:92-1600(+)
MALSATHIGLMVAGGFVLLSCALCIWKARQAGREEVSAQRRGLSSPLVDHSKDTLQIGGKTGQIIDMLYKRIKDLQSLKTHLEPTVDRLLGQDAVNRRIFDQLNSQQRAMNEIIAIQDGHIQEHMRKIDKVERQEQCMVEQVDAFVREVIDETARLLHSESEYHNYRQRKFQETMLQATAERAAGVIDSRRIEEQLALLQQMLREQQRDREGLHASIDEMRSQQHGGLIAAVGAQLLQRPAAGTAAAGSPSVAAPEPAHSPGRSSPGSGRDAPPVSSALMVHAAPLDGPEHPYWRRRRVSRRATAPPGLPGTAGARDPEGSPLWPYSIPPPPPQLTGAALGHLSKSAAQVARELPTFHSSPPRLPYDLPPPPRGRAESPAVAQSAPPSPSGSPVRNLRPAGGGTALRPARDFFSDLHAASGAVTRIEGLARGRAFADPGPHLRLEDDADHRPDSPGRAASARPGLLGEAAAEGRRPSGAGRRGSAAPGSDGAAQPPRRPAAL